MSNLHKAMTIAGSDSGGGAGIQADLKTFTAYKVYGTCAVTAVTAQNTAAITEVHWVPAEVVVAQMHAVFRDIGADAVKTGLLSNVQTIEAVADCLDDNNVQLLVVDPVRVSTSGRQLIDDAALDAIKRRLIPRATIITPNRDEAAALLGREVAADHDAMLQAARDLLELGSDAVVLTGGDVVGPARDYYADAREVAAIESVRVDVPMTHGTGCVFSAAITSCLARGLESRPAVAEAQHFVRHALRAAAPVGSGGTPPYPLFGWVPPV